MSSEALESLLHPPKMSFVWCMAYSAEAQTSFSEKSWVPPSFQEEAYKYFIADRNGSDFAFRNLESLA